MLAELPKTETIIAIVSFLGSSAVMIFIAGRWSQKIENNKSDYSSKIEAHKKETKTELDGLGARVSKVELGLEHEEGRVDALEVQLSRTQGQYEALIRILGEAKGSVDQFRIGMQASGEKIEKKIEELKDEQTKSTLELSQRLVAVESSIQHLERSS